MIKYGCLLGFNLFLSLSVPSYASNNINVVDEKSSENSIYETLIIDLSREEEFSRYKAELIKRMEILFPRNQGKVPLSADHEFGVKLVLGSDESPVNLDAAYTVITAKPEFREKFVAERTWLGELKNDDLLDKKEFEDFLIYLWTAPFYKTPIRFSEFFKIHHSEIIKGIIKRFIDGEIDFNQTMHERVVATQKAWLEFEASFSGKKNGIREEQFARFMRADALKQERVLKVLRGKRLFSKNQTIENLEELEEAREREGFAEDNFFIKVYESHLNLKSVSSEVFETDESAKQREAEVLKAFGVDKKNQGKKAQRSSNKASQGNKKVETDSLGKNSLKDGSDDVKSEQKAKAKASASAASSSSNRLPKRVTPKRADPSEIARRIVSERTRPIFISQRVTRWKSMTPDALKEVEGYQHIQQKGELQYQIASHSLWSLKDLMAKPEFRERYCLNTWFRVLNPKTLKFENRPSHNIQAKMYLGNQVFEGLIGVGIGREDEVLYHAVFNAYDDKNVFLTKITDLNENDFESDESQEVKAATIWQSYDKSSIDAGADGKILINVTHGNVGNQSEFVRFELIPNDFEL